jgi:NAD(P)-dependent dehydrogenase (short-subunit alcohol dehydrogenase family)
MSSPPPRAVVVTGASTGIGRAIAEHLAAHGFYVFGSVRKDADAADLAQALGAHGEAIALDVRDAVSLASAADTVAARLNGRTLWGLVNNAGIALPGPALVQPMDEIERVVDVNFLGVVRSTQAFGPLLAANLSQRGLNGPPGRIINLTSVSGKFGYPFTAAYVATKHAVEGYSESIRRELMIAGVDVSIVGPGAVKTPIWAKGGAMDRNRYEGTIWDAPLQRLMKALASMDEEGLAPQQVAEIVTTALSAAKPKTRYAIVPNPLVNWWLARLLPPRVVDRFIAKQLGLDPPP